MARIVIKGLPKYQTKGEVKENCKDGYGCQGKGNITGSNVSKKDGISYIGEGSGKENYVPFSNAPLTWNELLSYNNPNIEGESKKTAKQMNTDYANKIANRTNSLQTQFPGLTENQLRVAGADSARIKQRITDLPTWDRPANQSYDRAWYPHYRGLMKPNIPVTVPQILQFQSQQPGGLSGYEQTVTGNYGKKKYQVGGQNCPEGYTTDAYGECVPDGNNIFNFGASPSLTAQDYSLSKVQPQTYPLTGVTQSATGMPSINNMFGLNSDINGNTNQVPTNPNAVKQYEVDKTPGTVTNLTKDVIDPRDWMKKQKRNEKINNFSNKFGKFSNNLGIGLDIASVPLNLLEQRKQQKAYDEWSRNSNLPDNYNALNTNQDRGDYDINNGMFRPNLLGFKSKGMSTNIQYPQKNFSKYGGLIKADEGMLVEGDKIVQSEFVPNYSAQEMIVGPTRNINTPVLSSAPSSTSTSGLTLTDDFNDYAAKAQKYISKLNPNTDITGEILASGAQKAYKETGKIVPVELALAQLQQEGYLAKTKTPNKPQRTKNPFNYNNKDDGSIMTFESVQDGVNKYYDLIATRYLKDKEPDQLLNNFVNTFGNRYASARNYEDALKNNIKNINKYINSDNSQSSSDLVNFAGNQGFDVTSTTGGSHNEGSKHYQGKAVDVRTRNKSNDEISNFMAKAQQQGFKVLDERQRPKGQAVWSGPHLHLETLQNGGSNNNNMKIRIVETPDESLQFASGGQPPYSGQSNYGLYIGQRNLYKNMAKHPYEDTNNSVSEQPETKDNPHVLEAEDGEVITRPDGTTMNITGRRHSEGGEKLNKKQAPEGSFIYSDTAKMKIGGDILQNFGKSKNSSKKYTPAQLAKQYDVNKFRGILSDPNTDDLQKVTARRMLENYERKLAELAIVQEGKKGFPQGIPDIAKPLMAKMGMSQDNQEQPNQNPQSAKFGGGLKQYQGDVTGSTVKNDYSWFKPFTSSKTEAGRITRGGKNLSSLYDANQENQYNDVDYWVKDAKNKGVNINNTKDLQKYIYNEIGERNPETIKTMWSDYGPTLLNNEQTQSNFADNFGGARTGYLLSQRRRYGKEPLKEVPRGPLRTTITTRPPGNIPGGGDIPEEGTDMDFNEYRPNDFTPSKSKIPWQATQQDINNVGSAATNLALLKKYHMQSTPVQPTLPDFVPVDWRGYAASLQSGANSAAQQMGTYQPGQAQASNLSFLAGQQGENLSKYIGQTDLANAAAATQNSAQRADILNKFNEYNASKRDYDKDYENTADSKYRAMLAHGIDRLTGAENALITNRAGLYAQNMSESPDYYYNPRNQQMRFLGNDALQRFLRQRSTGNYNPADTFENDLKEAYKYAENYPEKDREKIRELYMNRTKPGKATQNVNYPLNPSKNRQTSYTEPTYNQYGVRIS